MSGDTFDRIAIGFAAVVVGLVALMLVALVGTAIYEACRGDWAPLLGVAAFVGLVAVMGAASWVFGAVLQRMGW